MNKQEKNILQATELAKDHSLPDDALDAAVGGGQRSDMILFCVCAWLNCPSSYNYVGGIDALRRDLDNGWVCKNCKHLSLINQELLSIGMSPAKRKA